VGTVDDVYTRVRAQRNTHTRAQRHSHTRAHIHSNAHTFAHTYIRIHTQTHARKHTQTVETQTQTQTTGKVSEHTDVVNYQSEYSSLSFENSYRI